MSPRLRRRYVTGDFRFRFGYCKSNPRKMVKARPCCPLPSHASPPARRNPLSDTLAEPSMLQLELGQRVPAHRAASCQTRCAPGSPALSTRIGRRALPRTHDRPPPMTGVGGNGDAPGRIYLTQPFTHTLNPKSNRPPPAAGVGGEGDAQPGAPAHGRHPRAAAAAAARARARHGVCRRRRRRRAAAQGASGLLSQRSVGSHAFCCAGAPMRAKHASAEQRGCQWARGSAWARKSGNSVELPKASYVHVLRAWGGGHGRAVARTRPSR